MARVVDQADISAILEAFERSCFGRLDLQTGATRLAASRSDGSPARVDGRDIVVLVSAPRLGFFEPLLSAGARVGAETAIGRVVARRQTAMVPAGRSGILEAILVGEQAFVEYGQPVARIAPDDRGDAS